MKTENFDPLWLSVKMFARYSGMPLYKVYAKCKSGKLPCELVDKGQFKGYRINAANFIGPALKKYLHDFYSGELEEGKFREKNALFYAKIPNWQRQHIHMWLPIMLYLPVISALKKTKDFAKSEGVSYPSMMQHYKLWKESGGLIESQVPRYGNRRKGN